MLHQSVCRDPRHHVIGMIDALQLIATACSNPPQGHKRWTLDLLAGEMVRLTKHEGVSRETVRRRPGGGCHLRPLRPHKGTAHAERGGED
jgi:hypothetical protein